MWNKHGSIWKFPKTLRPCLDAYFLSLNFHHSIFVTHHLSLIILKYYARLAPSLGYHHSIFFTLFVGPIPITRCSFFFPVPRNPNQKPKKKKKPRSPEPSERRKGKKKKRRNPDHRTQWKKKKKNPETRTQWKKKKVDGSKGATELWLVGPSCVFNYKNAIELWVLETKNN